MVFSLALSARFYKITLQQDEKLNELAFRLDKIPEPISRDRMDLIIKKANANLETKVKDDLELLEEKIQEIEKRVSAFPKPLSEGKVGLILDQGIQRFREDIENKVNRVVNSLEGKDQTFSGRKGLSPEIRDQLKELESSLEGLTGIIGLEQLSKSVTEEIADLKLKFKGDLVNDFQSDGKSGESSSDLDKTEDFAVIVKQFSDYAYQAIKEDLRSNKKDGLVNSAVNKFQLIFVQRSLTPQEGNSVDAILSRTEKALNLRDYEKVVEELNELPQGASEVMMDWKKSFEKFLEEKR